MDIFQLLLYLILTYTVYKIVDKVIRIPVIRSNRYILVTGCDTGFGNLLVRRLDSLGNHVFAGCLTSEGMTELKAACSNRVVPIQLDVTRTESVQAAFKFVKNYLGNDKYLWSLVNNAGVLGKVGPPEWFHLEDYKSVAAVNFYGVIEMTMTFLPLLKRSRGRVVSISSVVGRTTLTYNIPYCTTKYGVEAFVDGMRRAMRPFSVKMILIEPGRYFTALNEKKNVVAGVERSWAETTDEIRAEYGEEYHDFAKSGSMSLSDWLGTYNRLDDVIDAYEHAILGRYPRARYLIGNDAKFYWMTLQYLPEWLGDWIQEILDRDRPLPAAVKQGHYLK